MIDTGGNISFDMAKESLIPFLNKRQINHIDLLVTTHSDMDHAGAASSLVHNFKVNTYYTNSDFETTQVGDIYLENLNTYNADNENDRSLVFNVSFMGKKWLFTGDASISVEHDMILKGKDLDCDILKVGHHGSKTSTSEEFLLSTTPTEAIISCGAKNSYHHPDKEVIDRLTAHGVKIRYTKQEGTISYVQLAT
jgi:beta-lactamase superfamily II metal-dependent hydrolase